MKNRIEKEPCDSMQLFIAFMDNLPAIAFIKDARCRYIYLNRKGEDLLCTSGNLLHGTSEDGDRAEDEGEDADGADNAENARKIEASDRFVLKSGKSIEVEECFFINGQPTDWLVKKFPLIGENGLPEFVCGIALEITERKRNEQELIRYRNTLEEMVASRTAKLSCANEQLKKANQAKDEFLSNMSHEIRTPLNSIIGFTEIVMNAKDMDTVRERSRLVLDESKHLLKLVGEILDHSKIESHRVALESRPFSLKKLIASICLNMRVLAEQKGLRFLTLIGDETPDRIVGDKTRLRQIFLNLIGNAIKFTRRGSVTVQVQKLEREEGDSSDKLYFSIEDTGIGIPEEKQEQIFQAFTQADAGTTREFGGTGLGLTIAKNLVQLMGGNLGLKSESGTGSRFWFTIPLQRSDAKEPSVYQAATFPAASESANESPDTSVSESAAYKHGPGRILVVDDYPTNRILAQSHLEGAGHEVWVAGDGQEAVELCECQPFDLIIMDLQMPKMDGYQVTRMIRAGDSPCKEVPIIAMTADASASAREASFAAGMCDLVNKPIRRASFLKMVAKWLKQKTENSHVEAVPEKSEKPETEVTLSTVPLDYDAILDEFSGNQNLLQIALEQFNKDLAKQRASLQEAVLAEDRQTVYKIAHKFKGAAVNLTAEPLAKAAEQFEILAAEERWNDAVLCMNRLDREIKRFLEYLGKVPSITRL